MFRTMMTKLGQRTVFIILIGIISVSSMLAQQTGGAGGSSSSDIEKMMQAGNSISKLSD